MMSPKSARALSVPQRQQKVAAERSHESSFSGGAAAHSPKDLAQSQSNEGDRRWDRMVGKRELEEVDGAAELWNYLRGKASKIDFSDLRDGELNLIAAGLFQSLESRMIRRGPQGVPPERASGAAGMHGSPEAEAPQGGTIGKILVLLQLEMMKSSA